MKKFFIIFIIILLFPLTLTSCWNYADINMRTINLCTSIDEEDNDIKFITEIAKLNTTEINKSKVEISDIYTLDAIGNSFESTRKNYDNRVINQDFSGALRAVVFSKKYAENRGIGSYMNRLNYVNQFRNSVLVVISDEDTKSLFSKQVENDISVGYSIENTLSQLADNGKALYKSAQQIVSDIRFKNIGYLVPYITRDNGSIKYLGLAVMKNSKMIGVINNKESMGILFLLSKKPNMNLVIPHPEDDDDNLISTKVYLNKRKINTSYKNNHVVIDIDLTLVSEIVYEYHVYPLSDKNIKTLEEYISNNIKNEVISIITKSKKEFKCDLFQFARYFKGSNYKEYKNMDWEKEYENADINVKVKTTIKHSNFIDPNGKVPTTKK